MATQPRPWFRLGSISRPTTTPAPAPGTGPTPAPALTALPAPMIRPQLARPLSTIQPPQAAPTPQQEAPAPQPEATTPPPTAPVTTSSPSSPPTRVSSPSSPPTRVSAPSSPPTRVSAPSSPPTRVSAPSSPPTRVSAPSSPPTRVSAPSSPPTRVSAPSSPATRVSAPSTSVPASATILPFPQPLVSQTTQAPQTTTTSVPSSPKASSVLITSTSLPPSPATKSVPPPTSPTTRATSTASTRVPSPGYFPRTTSPVVQTTTQSPKLKPTAPPPSPLTLPPPQVKLNGVTTESIIPTEAEQKTVLVQKNFEKPNQRHNGVTQNHELRETHGIVHNGINSMSRELINSMEKSTSKKLSDSEDMGAKVITIAGENKGAVMELIQSPKKQEFGGRPYSLFNKGPLKSGTKSGSSSSSSSDEGNPKAKKDKAGKAKNAQPMSAFMNSNIQGVNNSIMFNSSCNHHDPGVHYALLRKPAGGGFYVKNDPTGLHN